MEELLIGITLFFIILITLMPLDKIFPNRNLHKLIIFLNQRSYKINNKNQNEFFYRILFISDRLYKLFNIKIGVSKYEFYKNKLILAGLSERVTVEQFVGIKILATLVSSFYFLIIFFLKPSLLSLLLLLFGLVMSYFIPDSLISTKIKRRQWEIETELPNILNSLAIITDAGLNLMEAIKMICEVRNGTLVNEFKKMMDEINIGIMQREALLHLSDRCQVYEVTVFIFTLIQAQEKGTSGVSLALNNQSSEVWEKRKNKAKEAGQRASVKLFFSMLLLVFPCLLIFLLGPALFSIFQFFE